MRHTKHSHWLLMSIPLKLFPFPPNLILSSQFILKFSTNFILKYSPYAVWMYCTRPAPERWKGSNFLDTPVSSVYPAEFRRSAGLLGSGAAFQTNLLWGIRKGLSNIQDLNNRLGRQQNRMKEPSCFPINTQRWVKVTPFPMLIYVKMEFYF